jgi:UDP-2,3-diacylglucosamine pyrophosphatase LpxH
MRIAAISDFHIGATALTDTFGHAEDAFLRWLDRLEARHDRIVLLGDIYQTDHSLVPGKKAAIRLLERARERLAAFTRRTSEAQYLWVHGNHDPVTAEVLGAKNRVILGEPGSRALFTHGDDYDPVIRSIPRLSAAGTWFAGRTRALGLRRLAEYLEDKDVEVKAGRASGAVGPYALGARPTEDLRQPKQIAGSVG